MANRKSERDKARAAEMKRLGIERTTGICALCYKLISIQGPKSKYAHNCPGGRIR